MSSTAPNEDKNSREKIDRQLLSVSHINETLIGKNIWIRGRFHQCRNRGRQCFFILRGQWESIQAVVCVDSNVSKSMVQSIAHTTTESIIDVEGKVSLSPNVNKSCTKQNVELQVKQICLVSGAEPCLPMFVEDAMRPMEESNRVPYVPLEIRLDNRVLDLRTPGNQAIFRLEAGVCSLFRQVLDAKDFLEIHTPKITTAILPEIGQAFQVNYFGLDAYLTRSTQVYQQMAIAADFEKVYTVGTVFDVVNATTHRHLTEYISLDLKMSFRYHYCEVLDTIGDLFTQMFKNLAERFATEIDIINEQFSCEPFECSDSTLCLEYKDIPSLLAKNGIEINLEYGLTNEEMRLLGKTIKDKYHTDFFILDKEPIAIQPFSTMPDAEDPRYSNSYGVFMRGDRILSGAQHIHDVAFLLEQVKHLKVNIDHAKPYIDAIRSGCPPHASGQIGLERFLIRYLGLNNVRQASMFPHDSRRLTP